MTSVHGYQKTARKDQWVKMDTTSAPSSVSKLPQPVTPTRDEVDDLYAADPCVLGFGITTLSPTAIVRGMTAVPQCETNVTSVIQAVASAMEENPTASPSLSGSSLATSVVAYKGIECETVTPVSSAAVAAVTSSSATFVTAPAASVSAPDKHFLSDEDIVDYLTRNPTDDCLTYPRQLLQSNQLTYVAASQLDLDMLRAKRMLSRYSSNLIVRRSQVVEDSNLGDPDAYLRSQLYQQSGQKL